MSLIYRRSLSSSPIVRGDGDNDGKGQQSGFGKKWAEIKKLAVDFTQGCKQLGADVKLAAQYRMQESKNPGSITRSQAYLVRQTKKDLTQALPLVIWFMTPLIGWFAPLGGVAFPRYLLSRQFWTQEQKFRFALLDYNERSCHFDNLLAEALAEAARIKSTPEVDKLVAQVYSELDKDGPERSREAFIPLAQLLANNCSLDAVSDAHLRALARSINQLDLYPAFILRNRVKSYMKTIAEDNALLLRDGLESQSTEEILLACVERGIEPSADEAEMRDDLQQWLAFVRDANVGKSPVALGATMAYLGDD